MIKTVERVNDINTRMEIKRGDVLLVDFVGVGSVQQMKRPAVVVSNNMANKYSPVITVCPLTTKASKRPLPTHFKINATEDGVKYESTVLCEQVLTVDVKKQIVGSKLFTLGYEYMQELNKCLAISMGMAI